MRYIGKHGDLPSPMHEPLDAEPEYEIHKPSKGELRSVVLAVLVMCYGIYESDLPVVFLTLGFSIYELRYFAAAYCGDDGKPLAGMMKGLGLMLSVGAFVLFFI